MTDIWTPAVELDLDTASQAAFEDMLDRFKAWTQANPPTGPFPLATGWHDITPQVAQEFLRRNTFNRKPSLATVKKYSAAMKAGNWQPTGEGILVNKDGKGEDGQHRALAGLLGMVAFHSFVVADVPVIKELFAYIDDCKPRSAADALYTSGNNGLSTTLAAAIKLAWRYDHNALTVMSRQPHIREATVPEVLNYAKSHPALGEAAHLLVSTYPKAAKMVGNKAVATLFLWKAVEHHDAGVVDRFLDAVGTGANLDSDSPILGFRERLRKVDAEDEDMPKERRLALLIKAFNMHLAGKKIGKSGLYVKDNEKFPRLDAQPPFADAAE